jgi:hypothetical protein
LSLQDNAAPHKAAIMHQKLVDLHLQLWKTRPTHFIWPLLITASSLPEETPQGKTVFKHWGGYISCRWMAGLKKLGQQSHKYVELREEYVNTFFNPIDCCFLCKAKLGTF